MSPLPAALRRVGEKAVAAFEPLQGEAREEAVRVFAVSEFAAAAAGRQREWFLDGMSGGRFEAPFDDSALDAEVNLALGGVADLPGLQAALRGVRQRLQLWLVWRHCLGRAALEETTGRCSAMADVLIDAALERLYTWLCQARGTPEGGQSGEPQRLVVFALGKLGARELNLSSDVDLTFCYPEAGRTAGGELNQQFFVRLGQQLIQALDPVTADGFVFRVDMRLRPYGTSGPLALDFGRMEDYYATQGRDWERYALMKARAAAGDRARGQALLEELSPFVYRRYLDFGAIDALRDMKARLIADRQSPDDVKLGPGGIRDVEFCVQMQQMIWGGREPRLRTTRLLDVIPVLEELGHLDAAETRSLADGYRFLRDTEHSLQAEADRQTQLLPGSELGRARLAVLAGCTDYAEFQTRLDGHRQRIAAVFEGLLGTQPDAPSETLMIWRNPEDESRLAAAGFQTPGSASEALLALARARDRAQVSANARERLDLLMPSLLEDVLDTGTPDLGLGRVLPVIRSVLRRSAYLSLLAENPDARAHFVSLVSTSLWLAQNLAEHPAFFDALLDERRLTLVPDRRQLGRELAAELDRADGFERALEVLREFKHHHVFDVALAELRGTLTLMQVSDALTYLAEALLEAAVALAWEDQLERFPAYADERDFIVVGYGKLGGIELGPGSDLDLVFIHELPGTPGPFLQRLVRRLLHVLSAPTYNGTLYEIDTRLRPSGNSGTMVSSLAAFADYQRRQAWVWEHQALVRARPVAGAAALAERFAALRRELLGQPRERGPLARAVREMRDRMRGQLRGGAAAVDLKHGSGGIVDIEFVVQYLVLAHAHDHPPLTEFTDNVRILDAVEQAGLLPDGAAQRLKEAYVGLRAEWHRSVLDIPDTQRAARTLTEYADDVRAVWQLVFAD